MSKTGEFTAKKGSFFVTQTPKKQAVWFFFCYADPPKIGVLVLFLLRFKLVIN